MTSLLSSYRLFQKLHPLSLLEQLRMRRVTGCLSVFTERFSWSIYLEDGKLTYASYSEKLFERIEIHLQRVSPENFAFNSSTYEELRLMLNSNKKNADYQALCWLVNQEQITAKQAATLIEEIAKEVLEPFLCLKEGNYKFDPDNSLNELPKFCHLELGLIVKYCQKQLPYRQNIKSLLNSSNSAIQAEPEKQPRETLSQPNNLPLSEQLKFSKDQYTIACIDDSPTVLNCIKYFLDENKFSVVTINDPLRAFVQVIKSKPDLIFLDVTMPTLDGYELCSILRKHALFKNTPIIMVTGRKGFIDKTRAKFVKSSDYLTKPFNKSDLLKMISKHICPLKENTQETRI